MITVNKGYNYNNDLVVTIKGSKEDRDTIFNLSKNLTDEFKILCTITFGFYNSYEVHLNFEVNKASNKNYKSLKSLIEIMDKLMKPNELKLQETSN